MLCAVSLGAAAQSTLTYPYNPDGNADALIGVTDLQDMLSVYGGAFSPSDIQIDGVGLAEVIGQLQATVEAQQAYITQLQHYISISEETVLISGANLQVVSGEGATDATVNGLGNIIVGYDENTSDDKSGSHNLVVGYGHTYSSYGSFVAGQDNNITGNYTSISGVITTPLRDISLPSREVPITPLRDISLPSWGVITTPLRVFIRPSWGG